VWLCSPPRRACRTWRGAAVSTASVCFSAGINSCCAAINCCNAGAPPRAGGTLSEKVNQPLVQDADYSIFAGIELTLAYDWPGCPDDAPYGPVTLGTTPVVRARACERRRHVAAGRPDGEPAGAPAPAVPV